MTGPRTRCALLGDLNRVQGPARSDEPLAAALVEGDFRIDQVPMVLPQPVRAQMTTGLFLRGDHQQQITAEAYPVS
jgi:hypothetical protein